MTTHWLTPARGVARRRCVSAAFAMIEAIVATLIISMLLVAALNAVGAARVSEFKNAERGVALLLARDLMSEILQQNYCDGVLGAGSFGLRSDEVGDGSRALWEDVDDYDGWSASPPQARDGTPLTWATGYKREVAVAWVASTDLTTDQSSETGIKRITVTVAHDDRTVLSLTAFRTDVWSDPVEARREYPR